MNDLLLKLSRFAILAFLLVSMLELGLTLTFKQILAPLKTAGTVVLALLANFIVVPLLALGIAKIVRLEQPFAIGLLLLGVAPGAPFIPKVVQLARGNVAFATGLMVMLMVGTAFDLPLLLPRMVGGAGANAWQMEKSLLLLMLLPLFIALGIHAKFRLLPAWLSPTLNLLSNASGVLALTLIVTLNLKSVFSVFGTGAILAGVLFILLSVFTGWLLGGRDAGIRQALGLGTGLRNVAAALLVAAENFQDPRVSVMVIATAVVGLVILLPLASVLGRRAQPATPALRTLTSHSRILL